VDNILQVLQRARETIDTSDDQGVAGLHKVEQHLQLGAPVASAAACLLGTHHAASGRSQCLPLQGEVLVIVETRA